MRMGFASTKTVALQRKDDVRKAAEPGRKVPDPSLFWGCSGIYAMSDPAPSAPNDLVNIARCVRNAPRQAGRGLIRAYRYTLSPLIGFHCRHLPTCSEYGDEALHRHGLWAGGWMTLGRVCRCHPYGTSGLDFVPAEPPPRARWYLPWLYARWRSANETPPAAGS
jgi:putative membrane protein insertion efficiency factor